MFFVWIRVNQHLGCRTYWLDFMHPDEMVAGGGFHELLLNYVKQLRISNHSVLLIS